MTLKKTLNALKFHIPVLLLALLMIYPLAWMMASSLKENSQVFITAGNIFVSEPHWENYIIGWNGGGRYTYGTFFSNSLLVTVLSTIGATASSSLVAFSFARIPFKGKNLWFALVMGTMLLPNQVLIIPQYIMFRNMRWINTYLPMIVPQFCGSAFFIFLNMQFMRGVPAELDEAAKIDGCGWFKTYYNILLPLSVPSLVTSAIFSFYWSWQDILGPLIYLSKPKKYTVSLALKMFSDPQVGTNWSGLFSMSVLSLIPVLIIFVFFQKYLVEGVATTGLKG